MQQLLTTTPHKHAHAGKMPPQRARPLLLALALGLGAVLGPGATAWSVRQPPSVSSSSPAAHRLPVQQPRPAAAGSPIEAGGPQQQQEQGQEVRRPTPRWALGFNPRALQLAFVASLGPLSSLSSAWAADVPSKLDLATISRLQDEAFRATNRFAWADADKAWTKVLEADGGNAAAYSNRGNTRTSMGRCEEAVRDFDKAIELAPKEPDPHLGRGVARECLRQFDAALQDYEEANRKNVALTGREDPVTYNNRANAEAGLGRYAEALDDYRRAAKMQPGYVFPLASAALTLYQLGQDAEAEKQMRLLLVKYPELVDMRAALAVLAWKKGDFARAESEWYQVVNSDPRYRKVEWARDIRRWPPRMVSALDDFIKLKLPSAPSNAGL